MSIEVIEITPAQAQELLSKNESHFLDFKAIQVSPSKLTRSISAFANADGGELYIGIAENKLGNCFYWQGFSNVEDANAHLQTFSNTFPLNQYCSYTFLKCSNQSGLVLYVNIEKTKEIIKTSDNNIFLRFGAQNLPQTDVGQLEILRRNKGITSFEIETVNIEKEEITNSEIMLTFALSIIPNTEPEDWLKKFRLITNNLPTIAGILLFSDLPQATSPHKCGIKIYRYKTTETEGRRESLAFLPLTIEGCIYTQIKEALERTLKIINEEKVLGQSNLERIQYPEITLHEIITNAVIHRDYGISDDVHVKIFDNRIEIESPGKLPGHITEKNILEERFSRNHKIVQILNKFPNPPNKDIGEGLNTAFEEMRKLRLKVPEIKQLENKVLVIIRHERLASPEDIILAYLEDHETITNREGRQLCAIQSENVMKTVFQRLRDRGLIELIPSGTKFQAKWKKTKVNNL